MVIFGFCLLFFPFFSSLLCYLWASFCTHVVVLSLFSCCISSRPPAVLLPGLLALLIGARLLLAGGLPKKKPSSVRRSALPNTISKPQETNNQKNHLSPGTRPKSLIQPQPTHQPNHTKSSADPNCPRLKSLEYFTSEAFSALVSSSSALSEASRKHRF